MKLLGVRTCHHGGKFRPVEQIETVMRCQGPIRAPLDLYGAVSGVPDVHWPRFAPRPVAAGRETGNRAPGDRAKET